jgi:hypothetical protein
MILAISEEYVDERPSVASAVKPIYDNNNKQSETAGWQTTRTLCGALDC